MEVLYFLLPKSETHSGALSYEQMDQEPIRFDNLLITLKVKPFHHLVSAIQNLKICAIGTNILYGTKQVLSKPTIASLLK